MTPLGPLLHQLWARQTDIQDCDTSCSCQSQKRIDFPEHLFNWQRADKYRCWSLLISNYFLPSPRVHESWNYFSCISLVFVCSFPIHCTVFGTVCTCHMISHFYDLLISSGVTPEEWIRKGFSKNKINYIKALGLLRTGILLSFSS